MRSWEAQRLQDDNQEKIFCDSQKAGAQGNVRLTA